MIGIPPILYKYMVQDGRMSKIIDSAPSEVMKLAKETDEKYFKYHFKHIHSNISDKTKASIFSHLTPLA